METRELTPRKCLTPSRDTGCTDSRCPTEPILGSGTRFVGRGVLLKAATQQNEIGWEGKMKSTTTVDVNSAMRVLRIWPSASTGPNCGKKTRDGHPYHGPGFVNGGFVPRVVCGLWCTRHKVLTGRGYFITFCWESYFHKFWPGS